MTSCWKKGTLHELVVKTPMGHPAATVPPNETRDEFTKPDYVSLQFMDEKQYEHVAKTFAEALSHLAPHLRGAPLETLKTL